MSVSPSSISGKMLILLFCTVALFSCKSPKKDYNLVLISLDTTRNDYIDTGKGARAFTPGMKAFAREAVVFERAFCTIPQTLPSHLSILTSYLPHECGVLSNQAIYDGRCKMLQQVLKERGYYTAAIISLGTLAGTTGIGEGFDEFHEGLNEQTVFYATAERITRQATRLLQKVKDNRFFLFLHYSDPHSPYAPPNAPGSFKIFLDEKPVAQFSPHQGAILRTSLNLSRGSHLVRFQVDAPVKDFDHFVIRKLEFSPGCRTIYKNIKYSASHYGGAHLLTDMDGSIQVKCARPGEMKIFQVIPLLTRLAAARYYRQEVEYMDGQVSGFIQALKDNGLFEKTIVVITGDHGEGLGEREIFFGHVRYLNQQFIRVPLIMHLPGFKAQRIASSVSNAAISPTLLEFIGGADDNFPVQRSLLPLLKKQKKKLDPVLAFTFSPSAIEDKLSVIRWPYQCIFNLANQGKESISINREFYNLGFSQSFNRLDEFSPDMARRHLKGKYQVFLKSFQHFRGIFDYKEAGQITAAHPDIEKLKSLGYLR